MSIPPTIRLPHEFGNDQVIIIRPDMCGEILRLGGKELLIEIFRSGMGKGYVAMGIDSSGYGVPLLEGTLIDDRYVVYSMRDFTPPKNTLDIQTFSQADILSPREAYSRVREWVGAVFRHEKEFVLDTIALHILYTWVHTQYGKKANVFVSGFFGTGKSVISQLYRCLGRNAVDLGSSLDQSSLWSLGVTKGVGILDETDVVTKATRVILRKMHDSGTTISKMMADSTGWNMLSLEISSPIVLVGTHLPEDPALLSRGFIVKTHYGEPQKDISLHVSELKELKPLIAKAMILRWADFKAHIWMSTLEILSRIRKVHARVLDILRPIVGMALMCDVDPVSPIKHALYSVANAMVITKSNRAIFVIARRLLWQAPRYKGFVIVDDDLLSKIVRDVAKMFHLTSSEVRYVYQYFSSASELCKVDGELKMCIHESDLEILKAYSDVASEVIPHLRTH